MMVLARISVAGLALITIARAVQYECTLLPSEVLGVGGMNNHGVVTVRTTLLSDSNIKTWTRQGGIITTPLPTGLQGLRFSATAINDRGDIFGNRRPVVGSGFDEGLTRIGADGSFLRYASAPPADGANAEYVTEEGAVVGFVFHSPSGSTAQAAWQANGQFMPTFNPATGNFINPRAINDSYQLCGYESGVGPVRIEADGTITSLQRLGNEVIGPAAINSYGGMVGHNSSVQKIYVWRQDGLLEHTIPITGNVLVRYNNLEHVLISRFSVTGVGTPYVWTKHAGLQSLIDSLSNPVTGLTLTYIEASNDIGQVIARGTLNGQGISVLLTPVPEPGTLVAMGMGFVAILRRRRSGSG